MPHGKETVLEVTGLTKQIKKTVIVDHLNFKLRKGDICGFLGENGAGKTTTLRMMAHLIFPTSGDVLIHGHSIRTDTRAALSQVGSIIENPTFYLSMTALQNLRLSAMLSDQHVPESKIAEALQKVKLENAGNQKVKTFSLGMKQRLGFANALLCDPSLIILDEPTNGLDDADLGEKQESDHSGRTNEWIGPDRADGVEGHGAGAIRPRDHFPDFQSYAPGDTGYLQPD